MDLVVVVQTPLVATGESGLTYQSLALVLDMPAVVPDVAMLCGVQRLMVVAEAVVLQVQPAQQ